MATTEDHANPKQRLAKERTDLADDRTILAHERTYAAWLRTGLAALAIGIGLERLLDDLDPRWLVAAISLAFILIALVLFLVSMWRYWQLRSESKLPPGRATPMWVVVILSLLAIASAVGAVYLAWSGAQAVALPPG